MVKKRGAIGIGIAVLAFSIVLGIASLPDEVLEESYTLEQSLTPQPVPVESTPQSSPVEIASNIPESPQKIGPPKTEEIQPMETHSNSPQTAEIQSVPSNPPKIEENESEEKSGGKLFKIDISDGVGSGDV